MPKVTTVYHYDDDRISHTETVAEAEWTEEDICWHKAYLRWRAELCPGCGLSLAETIAMHDGEPAHSYSVPDPARCYGCDALLKDRDERAKLKTVRPEALLRQVVQDR